MGAAVSDDGESVFDVEVSKVYPLLIAKGEKKGRTKTEADQVISGLTGYEMPAVDLDMTYKYKGDTVFTDSFKKQSERVEIWEHTNMRSFVRLLPRGMGS